MLDTGGSAKEVKKQPRAVRNLREGETVCFHRQIS